MLALLINVSEEEILNSSKIEIAVIFMMIIFPGKLLAYDNDRCFREVMSTGKYTDLFLGMAHTMLYPICFVMGPLHRHWRA
jgi:hypothetical protein